MTRVLMRRLGLLVPTILAGTLVIFGLEQMVPGGAAAALAGPNATPEVLAELDHKMGLDRPVPEQYLSWLGKLAHGDLGNSLLNGQSVRDEIANRIIVSAELMVLSLLLAVLLALMAGMVAGVWRYQPGDRVITTVSSIGLATPHFWLAMVLVLVLAVHFGILPATGYVAPGDDLIGNLKSVTLPCLALSIGPAAVLTRQVRSAVVEVLSAPFVRTARALGLPYREIYFKFVLKNAMLSVITVFGLVAAGLLGATAVIEVVFAIPGLGTMLLSAVTSKDFPVVQGVTLVYLVAVVLINLLIDLSYAALDPRVRVA